MQNGQGCFGIPKRSSGPNSEVYVDTGSGYGTTNTAVRTFSKLRIYQGPDIIYSSSPVFGDSFTVTTAGRYAITYVDSASAAATKVGITVNDTALTTGPSNMTFAQGYRGFTYSGTGLYATFTTVLVLNAGDVLRPKSDGNSNDITATSMVHIVKCD